MHEIHLIVNNNGDFEFTDGAKVKEDVWYEVPLTSKRFRVYEVSRQIDHGPPVYKTYISMEGLSCDFEVINFEPGTVYVVNRMEIGQLKKRNYSDLRNTPLPVSLDADAVKRLVDELLNTRTFRTLEPWQTKEFYNLEGFRRLMRRIAKREVSLLVLRWGLDGQPPRQFKDIGPMLVPAIKRSWAQELHCVALNNLRDEIFYEYPGSR